MIGVKNTLITGNFRKTILTNLLKYAHLKFISNNRKEKLNL